MENRSFLLDLRILAMTPRKVAMRAGITAQGSASAEKFTARSPMSTLAVLGAGGHGRVVADAAMAQGPWSGIAFYDDIWAGPVVQRAVPIVGDTASFLDRCGEHAGVIVALGTTRDGWSWSGARRRWPPLASVIHPAASISSHAALGQGVAVLAGESSP